MKQCLIFFDELCKQADKGKYCEEKFKEAGFDLNVEIKKRPAQETDLWNPEYYNSYVYYQE